MRGKRQRREGHEASSHGIDLAPMLDFVLNLLIFFIITAVFVKEFGLMVNRPGGAAPPGTTGEPSLPIQVLASGEIFIENRVVDLRAVRANVERVHAVSPKKGVLVIAEESAPAGLVIEIVDQVHQGGVQDVTFATGS